MGASQAPIRWTAVHLWPGSVEKAMGKFNIDVATWPELAADRPGWRSAIHGGLLVTGPPKRAAAVAADRLIDVAIADARASILDIDASIATVCARAWPTPPLPLRTAVPLRIAGSLRPRREASSVLPSRRTDSYIGPVAAANQ